MRSNPIKDWAEDERPREKVIHHGIHTLSNAELIAILFANGTRDKSAVDLARELLALVNNDVNRLARLSYKELQSIKGIGPAKAITIIAALELSRRRTDADMEHLSITSSKSAYDILKSLMQDLDHEIFVCLYLNQKNHVIHKEIISRGGISATVVDVRIILKKGIEQLASGIIIAHNHPSGNTQPSSQDMNITKQIKEGAQYLNINLLDHLIISQYNYLSFADEGLL